MKKESKIIGYKGFDKDFKCQNFQFEVGKEYVHDGDVKLCQSGFHFCENPLDVFTYYPPTSKFAQVEAEEVSDEKSDDTKRVSKKLKIGVELSLHSLINSAVKFIFEKADFKDAVETNKKEGKGASNSGIRGAASNSGTRGAASNSGDYGAASNSGYSGVASNSGTRGAASNSGTRGAASNSGDYGAASNSGKEGVAMSVGYDGTAQGCLGSWIVLSEWEYKNGEYHRIDVKSSKVDGKKIKADTFYQLKNGKFIEVK